MARKQNLFTGAALAATLALAGGAAAISQAREPLEAQYPGAPLAAAADDQTVGQASPATQYGTWGFDISGMDPKAKPGDSFYDFASGEWEAHVVIPADKARFGPFDILRDKSQDKLHAIIEEAAKGSAAADTETGKIGALYKSFMDEARIEMLDAAPIAEELAKIRDSKTRADIAVLMGRSRGGFGTSIFSIGVTEDSKNPGRHALSSSQAGLGLPDRDYYLRDSFKDKKTKYHDYIARMLDMARWPSPQTHADDILAFETRIAEASWSRAESRDRDKTYNPITPAELEAYAPGFPWTAWLAAARVGEASRVIVRQNTAFPKLATIFADTPVETLQAWAAFHLVEQTAPFLSKRFAEARFEFRGRELTGQPEEQARWKRGVRLVEGTLGEALGKEYVARYFPADSKVKMEAMVAQLKISLRGRIERLTWMSPETKVKALEKLSLFGVKIGYPSKWRDYSALKIDAADLLGNVRRASEFKWALSIDKLPKPVDPEEWGMTPQTVNAYYSSTRNEIVFPAAILQAPFFDPQADMAINYGGIGGVIGHEMIHGFDDQGRKSDGHGMLTDWWQPADAAKFETEAAKFGAQYDSYSVAPGVNVKGAQTMGENIADLGGLMVALDGYRASLRGAPSPVLGGYTGDQRVFLGWAQVWRTKSRPDALRQQVATDPHSPVRFRVDGPMRNVDAWYDAWSVKPGDKLYLKPEDRARIW
jgi:putative endopeptidase